MGRLTPEQLEEITRAWEENLARQAATARAERVKTGYLDIDLGSASDDPPVSAPEIQSALGAFSGVLHAAEIRFSQSAVAFDSVDAQGYPLAEFTIKTLGPPVITAITAGITGWFAGRAGRKARLKFGDIEAEAATPEEVVKLLAAAANYQASISKPEDKK